MAFSLENPGFSVETREDSVDSTAPEGFLQHSSLASPSTPSSGGSAHHACPRCYGWMSTFSVDRHSFCVKCLGSDCNIESRYDECMSSMESYVKLRKSLASKNSVRKSTISKAPSSPGPSAPIGLEVVDVDDRISSQLSKMSCEFDKKLEMVSDGLLAKFSEFMPKNEARITNRSISAEPEVPGRTAHYGQSLPLCHSVRTVDSPLQFQSNVGGPVPLGLGSAHPTSSGESLDRVLRVGVEPVQVQDTLVGGPEVAQPPSILRRPRILFAAPAGLHLVLRSLRMRRMTIVTLSWLPLQ